MTIAKIKCTIVNLVLAFSPNIKPFTQLVIINIISLCLAVTSSFLHSTFSIFLMATVNFFETFIWTRMRKKQWQELKLKFHYLLCSSLGTQLVSALCGPGIFTALASPPFIVLFLSSRLADCDVIACSLPLAVWDAADNYTVSEGPTSELEDGQEDNTSRCDCISRQWQEKCDHLQPETVVPKTTLLWTILKEGFLVRCPGLVATRREGKICMWKSFSFCSNHFRDDKPHLCLRHFWL